MVDAHVESKKSDTFEQIKVLMELHDSTPPQELVTFKDTLHEKGLHAAHACIWADRFDKVVGLESHDKEAMLDPRAIVLMHLRFDGYFGFAGGVVDEPLLGFSLEEGKEAVVQALNRELEEELNLDTSKHVIKETDYLFSTRSKNLSVTSDPLFLHFYAYKVAREDILDIEKRSMEGFEHGREVLGNIRVPLFTMIDGYRGFPAFLRNQFIGSSKWQLLYILLSSGIMTKSEIQAALSSTSSKPLSVTHPAE